MKNPQAFPQFSFTVDGHPHEPGMTLRDHFAGLAMQAMLSNDSVLTVSNDVVKNTEERRDSWLARQSYTFADAMLAEREK